MLEPATQISEPVASAIKNLGEAGLLLEKGIQKIFSTHEELSASRDPISEALSISERHALATLAAVEDAEAAVKRICGISREGAYIDPQLRVIQTALTTILASQQGQDLAGQRLKKAITLIDAVKSKIQATLAEIGVISTAEAVPETQMASSCSQEDVDALLEELGI